MYLFKSDLEKIDPFFKDVNIQCSNPIHQTRESARAHVCGNRSGHKRGFEGVIAVVIEGVKKPHVKVGSGVLIPQEEDWETWDEEYYSYNWVLTAAYRTLKKQSLPFSLFIF